MFIAELFTITKIRNNLNAYGPKGGSRKSGMYIKWHKKERNYAVNYHMDDSMLSEIRQSQKDKSSMNSLICSWSQKVERQLPEAKRRGKQEVANQWT